MTTTYTYDAIDQLESETRPGYACSYTYDPNGNRQTKTLNGVVETYNYDDADKLLSRTSSAGTFTYGYDVAGRTTSVSSGSNSTTLTYDYEDRVKTLNVNGTVSSYVYNALDTRVSKTSSVGGNRTYKRDGAEVTAPVLSDGNASIVPGISERRSGATKFLHQDRLGSTKRLTDGLNNVTDSMDYDAFGVVTNRTGTTPTQNGFAGGWGYQEDTESGLKLLGHRYYDAGTGRFLTRDPIGDGSNWYLYCENNPLISVDPEGLQDPVRKPVMERPEPKPQKPNLELWENPNKPTPVPRNPVPTFAPFARLCTVLGLILLPSSTASNDTHGPVIKIPKTPVHAPYPPFPGYVWRGPGEPGKGLGSWYNPETGESLHPSSDTDIGHGGDHWDYKDDQGFNWRIYPDGRVEVKGTEKNRRRRSHEVRARRVRRMRRRRNRLSLGAVDMLDLGPVFVAHAADVARGSEFFEYARVPMREMAMAVAFIPSGVQFRGELAPFSSFWSNMVVEDYEELGQAVSQATYGLCDWVLHFVSGSAMHFDDPLYRGKVYKDEFGADLVPDGNRHYTFRADRSSEVLIWELERHFALEWGGGGIIVADLGAGQEALIQINSVFDSESTMLSFSQSFKQKLLPIVLESGEARLRTINELH